MTMPLWRADQPLVLASRSPARRAMLEAAGIPLEVVIPNLNERATEAAAGPRAPPEAATLLAREKAMAVARQMPGRLVVGADQTLAFGTRRFDKPQDRAAARTQIATLSGNTHDLHSAVVVAQNGDVLFEEIDTARLTMRKLSEPFLDGYLDAVGATVLDSVGAYQLERLGINLFERIDGDHFTILGLPLLKLLAFLRRQGSLAA
jgi:septum formation protein